MVVSKKEAKSSRSFVCGQVRDEPDLSTLTLGILKKQYLAHVKCNSLSPEARNFMKQVVEEELVKNAGIRDNEENGSELETKKVQNKRKRGKENDEISDGEDEDDSRAKRSRLKSQSSSSSVMTESDEKEDCKTGSEESEEEMQKKSESEDEKQELKKSQQKTNGNGKQQMNSEDSTDEEIKGNETNCVDSPKEKMKKKADTTKTGEMGISSKNQGKKESQSDEEKESALDSKTEKSDKINSNESSDDNEKEEKTLVEIKKSDTDSSSLPSLEDEQDGGKGQAKQDKQDGEKKKNVKKKEHPKGIKHDNKAVVRLKRYITLCGVRRNYKKLLDGCRSVRSQVTVLKQDLEDLGVHGKPTKEKCKKARMKREEAQEIAELDVSNIIATQGRPKRRGASAWQEKHEPPSSAYLRTLNSSSDSDQDSKTHRGSRKATDWANLQGIISDDADSD
ncbi:HIRA-interacting protein 3 [Pempheris klunzingeri]|uniref:HIRA-interacting protein 3 n=1 Tax=Pempheris klunzingeri TaxID=3127111 RepID=UPI00397EBFEF